MVRATSIRAKLLIAFAGLALVPALVIGLWIALTDLPHHLRESWLHQRHVAERLKSEVGGFFQQIERDLTAIDRLTQFRTATMAEQSEILSSVLFSNPAFLEVTYLDETGRERVRIARNSLAIPGMAADLSGDEAFVAPARSGKPHYGLVRFDPITGEPLMTISLPLVELRAGTLQGVIRSEIRLRKVWEVVSKTGWDDSARAYVIDERGQVIAHRNPSIVLRKTSFIFHHGEDIQSGLEETDVVIADSDLIVGDRFFHVAVERDVQAAVRPALLGLIIVGGAIVASLGMAVLLILFAEHRIVRPIQAVTLAARAIRGGDLSTTVKATGSDEAAELAETFNAMAGRLRRTLDSLERERSLLRSLIDTIPDLIFIKDNDLNFINFNAAFEARTGMPRDELIGKGVSQLFPADEAAEYDASDHRMLEEGHSVRFEETGVLPDGILHHFDTIKLPYRAPDGRLLGLIGVARDITERKQTEDTLARLSRQNQLILDSAAEGIYGVDEKGLTTFMNKAGTAMLGWEPDDLIGHDQHTLFHHSHADGTPYPAEDCPVLNTLTEGGQTSCADDVFWRKDGTSFPVEFVSAPMAEGDRIIGAVVIFRDISERREAEQILARKTGELERSNSELQQFAYVASHDLQEPLRMVTSYLQLLERRLGEDLDERSQEFFGFAIDGSKRMSLLIKDLLSYSRVETRGQEPAPLESSSALTEALINLRVASLDTDAVITHEEDLPMVLADEPQLVRVFQNLIGNALKYHHPDRKPEIHVGATRKGALWQFTVRDNGIGMEPQYFERIFMIFQRLHGREAYEGTGIGLAICKKIIERHGGAIWVESVPDKGATFFFTLPAAER